METNLFVIMVTSEVSWQMKTTIISDLMFFKFLFRLVTWILLSFMKEILLLLLIGTITCFLDGLFIVMLILGLDLPSPLMIFLDFFYLISLEIWKCFFNLKNVSCVIVILWCLDIWHVMALCIVWLLCNLEILGKFLWPP